MKSVPLNAFGRSANSGAVKSRNCAPPAAFPPSFTAGRPSPRIWNWSARNSSDLIHHSASENILVDLAVDKAKRLALVQEVQHHPLSGKVLHVDFHEVSDNEKVTVMVPVETTGEAAGVKTGGGVLEHVLFKIKVRALPKDLPEQIVVDVTRLEVGKSIHLGEIKAPEGVEILGDKKVSVISVAHAEDRSRRGCGCRGSPGAAGDVEMTKEKKEDGTEAPRQPRLATKLRGQGATSRATKRRPPAGRQESRRSGREEEVVSRRFRLA